MPYITGRYEWDDDSLTPGQKKEGGIHGNLYDSEGSLRGSARFIPDDDIHLDDDDVTSTTYIPTEERRQDEESDALTEVASILLMSLCAAAATHAAPHIQRWWGDTAHPFFAAQADKVTARWHRAKTSEGDKVKQADEVTVLSQDLAESLDRPAMSSAEAQARFLAAMAAQAFSEEQLRLVSQADILDAEDVEDIKEHLARLPQEQLVSIIEQMARRPSLLEDEGLAILARLLGRTEPTTIQRRLENYNKP